MEPLRFALDSFIETTQRRATGKVRLKFHKGGMRVVGRSSPNSLYRLKLSTYSKESTFDQNSAVGFIELWGLQSRTAANAIAPHEGRKAGDKTWTNILRGSRVKRSSKKANEFTSSVGFDGPLSRHVVKINMAHMLSLIALRRGGQEAGGGVPPVPRRAPGRMKVDPTSTEDVHHSLEQDAIACNRDGGGWLPQPRKEPERPGRDRPADGDARARPRASCATAHSLQDSLLRVMARYGRLPLPGYTHLQRAQPTTVVHHMQSYFEALAEDVERLTQLYGRVNLSPMGAAAFAGTSVKIDVGLRRVLARVRRPGQQLDVRGLLAELRPRDPLRPARC